MSKLIKIIITVIILALIIWVITTNGEKPVQGTFSIGAIEALTGNASYYGVSTMKGVEIGKEEMSAKYPNLKFEVFHEDSLFTPKGGIDAYNKLRSSNAIDAVITMASNVSMAVEPLAIKDGITMIAASTLANNFSTPNDLTFRLTAKGDLEAEPALAYMQSQGKTRLAIIYMTNEIGVSLRDSLKKEAATKGVVIVAEEGYAPDTTDYRTILLKLKQLNPEVVYLGSLASHTAQILKQSDSLAFKPLFMSYRGAEDPLLIANAGILAEQVVYTNAFDSENVSPLNKNFAYEYKKKHGEDANGYAAEGYEALKLIIESFVECNKDYVCIQAYIAGIKNRPSVLGEFSFDQNGDVSYQFFLKTIKDGKFVKLGN